jgi:threonine/homoserine/homoserine lactone efflux protein
LGAAYLVYLGVKSLLAKQGHLAVEKLAGEQQSSWAAFRNGLLTNLLNPKCTLFLLSIFTMVVNPGTPKLVQATYGFEISFIALVWFAFLSCALTLPAVKLRIDKVQHIATKLIGLVLLVLAIVVVFEVR